MSVTIRQQRNPFAWFIFGAQIFVLTLFLFITAPVSLGVLVSAVFVAIYGLAWVTRAQKVTVYFDSKEAIFEYSRFNPFRQLQRIDLKLFTRAYVSVSHKTGACTIKLVNHQGKHMQLAYFLAPTDSQKNEMNVYQLCESIALGLGIKNGWGASTDAV